MKKLTFIILLLIFIIGQSCDKGGVQINGELKKWHKVTLIFDGPESSEWAKENPFLDYKMEVTFTNENTSYTVPGFYAADGNAGETSADSGNKWKVNFRPDKTGTWNYKVSFRKGKNIVVKNGDDLGEPVSFNNNSGSFVIVDTDKSGDDFRGKGRIVNGEKGYFKFEGTEKIWIKNGADSPENFLAFADFDQTSRFNLKTEVREGEADPKKDLHKYEPHINDWNEGDPTWQNGKGKGIIGALNYLASVGVNSQYMLTMNIMGDGKDVWPYNDHNERYRFDCSKLDQWEIVFNHMDKLGMMIHLVLQETENECLLDNGYTDVQRMVYLRELVARFGHHQAVTWNLGEENGPAEWSPIGQTDAQKRSMASYLKKINPYNNIVVIHTHSDDEKQDNYMTPLLGFQDLDGPSMQIGDPFRINKRIRKWVDESEKSGKRWLVNLDEIGQHWKGVLPDSFDPGHDTVRYQCLWGSLLAGATGVEWYFGYRYPHTDLTCEDFRSREIWWKQSEIATSFINSLPVEEMKPDNDLVNVKGAFCLAGSNGVYVIYLPEGTNGCNLKINSSGNYSVKWLNPRIGGELVSGKVNSLNGPGNLNIGLPPENDGKDWVVLVSKMTEM